MESPEENEGENTIIYLYYRPFALDVLRLLSPFFDIILVSEFESFITDAILDVIDEEIFILVVSTESSNQNAAYLGKVY